jgi:hemerythrin-like domain-containing protein
MIDGTMDFTNRVSQTLHDEHRQTIALVERLEQLIARRWGDDPPNAGDPGVARLLTDLTTWAEAEINRHFDFEEEQLFSYLAAPGDAAIGASLIDEHRVIRRLGARIATLAHAASDRPLDAVEWTEFRRLGQELCESIQAHVQKEEMALLPVLEDEMDPDTEVRLYQQYVDNM